ncbi:MAG: hypothetical protein AMJ53_07650 [Gammaproteobacteria bacterium SG8_11]|nr:MAG: hypothetical protein AMJ53_07650 [Gammaproteobacteria bacterium SG8_11]
MVFLQQVKSIIVNTNISNQYYCCYIEYQIYRKIITGQLADKFPARDVWILELLQGKPRKCLRGFEVFLKPGLDGTFFIHH